MDSKSLIGKCITERYELLEVAGTGGMGTVFKARQADLDRFVAVKILDAAIVQNDDTSRRFEREARALSLLSHAHIASFYAYGELDNSTPYIVMEYIDGQALSLLLESPLSVERTIAIAMKISDAMEFAHKSGIVHRDLKPGNILLQSKPEADYVKIVDFGLSLSESGSETLTNTGCVLGTPLYLSPEQCQGRKADARSDIYALGCIMYQMLSGKTPFASENPLALIHMHVSEAPPALSKICKKKIPGGINSIIMDCLEKNPDKRYQSMQELHDDLKRMAEGELPSLHSSESRRQKWWQSPLAVAIVCVVASSVSGIMLFAFSEFTQGKRGAARGDGKLDFQDLRQQLLDAGNLRLQGKIDQANALTQNVENSVSFATKDSISSANLQLKLAEQLYSAKDLKTAALLAFRAQVDLRKARKQRHITGRAGDVIDESASGFQKMRLKLEQQFKQADTDISRVNDSNSDKLKCLADCLIALDYLFLDRLDLAGFYTDDACKILSALRRAQILDESISTAALTLFDAYDTIWDLRIPYIERLKPSHICQEKAIEIAEAAFPDKLDFHRRYVFARSFVGNADLAGAEKELKILLPLTEKGTDDYETVRFDLAAVQETFGHSELHNHLIQEFKPVYGEIQTLMAVAKGQVWAGRYEAAHKTIDQAMNIAEHGGHPSADEMVIIYRIRAHAFSDAGEYAKAEPVLRQCISFLNKRQDDGQLFEVTKDLEKCLRNLQRSSEAEAMVSKYGHTDTTGQWFLSKRRTGK